MEKVRPWCGQPSDRGRLRNRNRYRLTWVVPERGPLIMCVSLCYSGLAEVEEGEVNGQELQLASTSVGRMSFGVPPSVQQVLCDFCTL